MGKRNGFMTMSEAGRDAGETPTLGVSMLGYAFMGKAHTNAYKTLDYIYTPPPAHPRLVAIAGRNRERSTRPRGVMGTRRPLPTGAIL